MNSPKLFTHFTDEEIDFWLEAWRSTADALSDAKLIAEIERDDPPNNADLDDLKAKIRNLEHEIVEHNKVRLAFYANTLALVPPNPETVNRIKQLSNRVDDLINTSKAAEHAVAAAIEALKLFNGAAA